MSGLLQKFKVVRCPIDDEVLRVRAFERHAKNKHGNQPSHWSKEILKEGVLVCISPEHHVIPAIELAANTRGGNNYFLQQHASHVKTKQTPLSSTEQEAVRRVLNENGLTEPPLSYAEQHAVHSIVNENGLTGPPPPPPNLQDAVGVMETPNQTLEQGEDVMQRVLTGNSPMFTPLGESSRFVSLDEIQPSLMLDEQDPMQVEPQVAQLLNNAYQSVYLPGLLYPMEDRSIQVDAPDQQQASTSMTDLISPPMDRQQASTSMTDLISTPMDQSTQIDAPAQRHISTSTTKNESDNTEDIPLLTQGLAHIREVNTMKNVMLSQILQDNIDLLQSKVQSRKRALQAMEELFEARATEPMSEDITLELSRIIHLKNKFMKQVLQETSRLQPQLFNLLSQN